MNIVEEMKNDMDLKDDVLYSVYDIEQEKLCEFFLKFVKDVCHIVYVDKIDEYGTEKAAKVLWKLMIGWYIPVNGKLLSLGRRRINYYETAIRSYMDDHNIEFGVPFTVEVKLHTKKVKKECVFYRSYKFLCEGEENLSFLFKHVLGVG